MPIEDVLYGARELYSETYFANPRRQIWETLFPRPNVNLASEFSLDKLVRDPHGITYRNKDAQSKIRHYKPGTNTMIKIPRASEKTPVTEDMRDTVVVGKTGTTSFDENKMELGVQIAEDHIEGHVMTKNKQAIDVLRTGIFEAPGEDGVDIGLDLDFGRAAGNSIAYDYTAVGATYSEATNEQLAQYISNKGAPRSNIIQLCGQKWLSAYASDENVLNAAQNNNVNQLQQANMIPPELLGTQGLIVHGVYRSLDMVTNVWVCSYSPGVQYIAYEDATAADWVPEDEAIMFSLDSLRWGVQRGVDVLDAQGKAARAVGEIVFDNFTSSDPVTEYFRSQTRHAFVPARINHTVLSTGTFA